MNKAELIAAVAEKAGLSKKDTEAVINATLNTITAALQDEEKVQLVGFGSFEMKKRAARTGLNPRTKEPVEIAATQVPVFKAGKALKDAVATYARRIGFFGAGVLCAHRPTLLIWRNKEQSSLLRHMSMGFASLCASAGYAGLRRSLRAGCFWRRTCRRQNRIGFCSRRCGGANSVRLWGGGPPLF